MRNKHGIYLGVSSFHSSTVYLVLTQPPDPSRLNTILSLMTPFLPSSLMVNFIHPSRLICFPMDMSSMQLSNRIRLVQLPFLLTVFLLMQYQHSRCHQRELQMKLHTSQLSNQQIHRTLWAQTFMFQTLLYHLIQLTTSILHRPGLQQRE